MGLILWIIFGALVGWLASLFLGTDASQGTMGNIILGVAGALVGGFVSTLLGLPGVTGFNLYSTLIAVGGAVIVVSAKRAIAK